MKNKTSATEERIIALIVFCCISIFWALLVIVNGARWLSEKLEELCA